jgi:hypothetical protein
MNMPTMQPTWNSWLREQLFHIKSSCVPPGHLTTILVNCFNFGHDRSPEHLLHGPLFWDAELLFGRLCLYIYTNQSAVKETYRIWNTVPIFVKNCLYDSLFLCLGELCFALDATRLTTRETVDWLTPAISPESNWSCPEAKNFGAHKHRRDGIEWFLFVGGSMSSFMRSITSSNKYRSKLFGLTIRLQNWLLTCSAIFT